MVRLTLTTAGEFEGEEVGDLLVGINVVGSDDGIVDGLGVGNSEGYPVGDLYNILSNNQHKKLSLDEQSITAIIMINWSTHTTGLPLGILDGPSVGFEDGLEEAGCKDGPRDGCAVVGDDDGAELGDFDGAGVGDLIMFICGCAQHEMMRNGTQ